VPQSDKSRVSLVVEQGQKERWKNAVENEHYKSLAELIRTSVRRELDGHHSFEESGGGSSAATADAIDELAGSISEIKTAVTDIQDRVARLEANAETQGLEYELQKLVFEMLPAREADEGPAEASMTADQIHKRIRSLGIEVNAEKVRETLEHMAKERPVVNSGKPGWTDGKLGYYKEPR
jgi:hypothetical protein